MRVAVAGGTGVLGRKVVARLEQQGHEPVVLARSSGHDLTTGGGLDHVLDGADSVIDVTSIATARRKAAVDFFTTVSRNLLDAEVRSGVRHHVLISIVGIDDIRYGYYEGKVAQEEVVTAGPVPWTILRTTQFHEFPGQFLERMSVGPVSFIPQGLSQPVAADEVAAALVELALREAAGRVPDLAGPQPEQMVDLARRLVRGRGGRRLVVPVPVPGTLGRAMRDGSLIPDGGSRGTETWDDWLERTGGSV